MLKDLFISEVRVKILKVLLTDPETPMHVRGITRKVGTEINAVRRELSRLEGTGLLKRFPKGNRVYFEVDVNFPYYSDLLSMISKEEGLGAAIIKNRSELGKMKFAFLSQAYMRGRSATAKDVDLVIVGAVDMRLLSEIVKGIEEKRGSEINYTVMGEDEFDFRKKRKDPFLVTLLTMPKIVLIGDELEYSTLS